jgi:hypothetical protein
VKYIDVNPILPVPDPELQRSTLDLKISLLLNSAQASLKIGTPAAARNAIQQTTRALALDGDPDGDEVEGMRKRLETGEKAKAYFRRAIAKNVVGEHEEALEDLVCVSLARSLPPVCGIFNLPNRRFHRKRPRSSFQKMWRSGRSWMQLRRGPPRVFLLVSYPKACVCLIIMMSVFLSRVEEKKRKQQKAFAKMFG